MYTPFPVKGFGGIDLRPDVEDLGFSGAIEATNVLFDEPGVVKHRGGSSTFGASAAAAFGSVAPLNPGGIIAGDYVMAARGTTVELRDNSGTVLGSNSVAGAIIPTMVQYGTPSANLGIIFDQGLGLRQVTTAGVFSTPATAPVTPLGRIGSVTPWDQRLLSANEPSDSSMVRLSDPGSITAWQTNNFIQLSPGDGQEITAAISWRDFVFVFKEHKFFVFYGTTVSSAGNPVFNYRAVDTGVGCLAPQAVCKGPDGVYFIHGTGVYKTTGDRPVRLSDPIQLVGGTRPAANQFTHGLTLDQFGRLYAHVTSGCWVLFEGARGWVKWDLSTAPGPMTTIRVTGGTVKTLYANATSNRLLSINSDAVNDNGTAVTASYQSGWSDLGDPRIKVVRETDFWGRQRTAGTLDFELWVDRQEADPHPGALDFNLDVSAPLTYPAWNTRFRSSRRGTLFSYRFVGAHLWEVSRMTLHVREARVPGQKNT